MNIQAARNCINNIVKQLYQLHAYRYIIGYRHCYDDYATNHNNYKQLYHELKDHISCTVPEVLRL